MITIVSIVSTLFAVGGGVTAIWLGDTSRDERVAMDYLMPVICFTLAIAGWMACLHWEYNL